MHYSLRKTKPVRLFDGAMFSTLSELDDGVRPVSKETHNLLLETEKHHGIAVSGILFKLFPPLETYR